MTHRVSLATRIFRPEPAAAAFRLGSLVDALIEAGSSVTVHTAKAPRSLLAKAKDFDLASPARILRHRVLRGKDEYLRGYVQYMSFDLPLAWHLLTDETPDVYVCEPPPTTGVITRVISTIKRRPYVYYAADIWSDAAEGAGVHPIVVSTLRAVERWVMSGAADVLAVNEQVAQRVEALGGSATVIRNGVDTDTFTPDGPASPLAGTSFFLYAGTMSEWQGSDIFVRAFASVADKLGNTRLVFVGQGSAVGDIRRAAEEAGIADRVDIVPPVSQDEAAAYQRDARAALVSIRPGIGYDMAFPTKAMAAWASGTPVIYAGPGIARTLITKHGLGWSCNYDVSEIADAMVGAYSATKEPTAVRRWAEENASLRALASRAAERIQALSESGRSSSVGMVNQ